MTAPRSHRLIWLLLVCGLALVGAGLLLFFLLPYSSVKPFADALSRDGEMASFTFTWFERWRPLAGVGAFSLAMAAWALAAKRAVLGWIERGLLRLQKGAVACRADCRAMCVAFRKVLAERGHVITLAVVFVLSAVNAARFLNRPMRYDEAYTFIAYASRPLWRIVTDYSLPNNHVFHSILVHLAYVLLGNQPWVVRLPAFLAGVLLVPAGYLAGKAYFNVDAALLGSALIAFFPMLVGYTTNARGYTILCLFTLVLMCFAAYVRSQRNGTAWVLMSVISALGFYTVPTMMYPFGAVATWLTLEWLWKDIALGVNRWWYLQRLILFGVLTAALTALLYAPVVVSNGLRKVVGNRFVQPLPWDALWPKLLRRLDQTWTLWNKGVPVEVMALLVVGFALSLVLHRRIASQRVSFAAVTLLTSFVLVVIQRVAPFDRMWLFLLPVLLIWSAAGLEFAFRQLVAGLPPGSSRWVRIVQFSLVAAVCWMLVSSGAAYHFKRARAEDFGRVVGHFLANNLTPGECVAVTFPDDAPIQYYTWLENPALVEAFKYDEGAQRVLVLVAPDSGQSVEAVLEKQKFPLEAFDVENAQPIYSYGHLTVYQAGDP